MRFEKVKLGELCDISSSRRIFAKEYVDEGIPFYRSKEIILKHNKKEITDPLFISYDRYEEIKEKYGAPKDGDILLTSVGTLGVPYIVNSKEKFYFKDGNLTWLKNFKEVVNNRYIYYWVQSKYGKNEINKITIGSTQQAITINSLKSLEIQLPSLRMQNKISRTLDAIYEKENNNLNIINSLEELAQTLFKRWFVDFEFPNEEGKPYKSGGGKMVESELGMIPEGWKIELLGNITEIQNGFAFKSKDYVSEGIKVIRTLNIDDKGLVINNDLEQLKFLPKEFYESERFIKQRLHKFDSLLVMVGATIGKLGMVLTPNLPSLQNQNMWRFRTKTQHISNQYIYLLLDSLVNQFIGFKSGSAREFFRKDAFSKIKVVIPNENYNDIMYILDSLFENIDTLHTENIQLQEIRDMLLPKLLSGEIELPDDMEVTDDVPIS